MPLAEMATELSKSYHLSYTEAPSRQSVRPHLLVLVLEPRPPAFRRAVLAGAKLNGMSRN